jgi:SNF2 family DNA or RNA helicase
MIILDESSKIKNPKANRSKAIHTLGRLTKYKIILNGTPITQGAQDIFSQFLFLDNGESFGASYEKFLQEYFYKEQYGWKWQIKGKEALDEISRKIYTIGTRFLKKECLDLPDKLYEQREITLTNEQWIAYCSMRDNLIAWIENEQKEKRRIDAQVIVTKLLRLSQITSGFSKDEFGKVVRFPINPKMQELEDDLDKILYNGNQLVVWARFVNDIEDIAKLLKEKGISYGMIYGKIPDRERTRTVDNFLNKKIKVFIGQQGSGGLGIDLFTANTVIYFSNDYTLLNRLQSEDRTHRKGSEIHNKVTYIDYLANGPNGEGTIDHNILNIVLKEKKNVADIITRDGIRTLLGLTGYNISNK